MAVRTAQAIVPTLFLVLLVAWPLVAVMDRSLADVGPGDIVEVLTRGSVRSVLFFTLWQAGLSAGLTLAAGLPIAHVVARYRFRGKTALRAFVIVPFVLPTVVVAAAIDAVFDELSSQLGLTVDRTLWAVLSAHVFFNVAVVVRVVGGYWSSVDRRQVEVAATLGASPVRAWLTVTLRQLLPVLAGSYLLVFLFSFTSFGVIRVLGGLRRATVETEIYRYAIARQEFDVAAVLAALQIVVVSVLAVSSARFQRRHATVQRGSARPVPIDTAARRVHVASVIGLAVVLLGTPVVVLVEQSLRVGSGYGFAHYRALVDRVSLLPISAGEALANSILFAVLAAVVATGVGVCAALVIERGGPLGRWLEAISLLPLGVSAVTLGFGYLVGLTIFDLRRSIWLIPAAHAVIGLPFVLASLVPALRSIDPRVREAAAILGASPAVVRRTVDWPLVRRAVAIGAGFAAAVSRGEFGATSVLARGEDSFTAPLAVFRLLSNPGEQLRGQAMALSVVIGILVAGLAAAIEVRRGEGVTLL